MSYRILLGDCLQQLRTLRSGSVHCCVTSPPYWGLRDYGLPPSVWGGSPGCKHSWRSHLQPAANGIIHRGGMTGKTLCGNSATRKPKQSAFCSLCGAWRGQLGLEPTPAFFVSNLTAIFAELRRVLRDDGTLWLNLGDSYCNVGKWGGGRPTDKNKAANDGPNRREFYGLAPKNLVGIPWRVAFALQADGWYLRSDIIWNKTNGLTESVRDRPTHAHEYVFLLSKSPRYYYDRKAVMEPCQSGPSDIRKMKESKDRLTSRYASSGDPLLSAGCGKIGRKRAVGSPDGRNRRTVWTMGTSTFRSGHFATFPPKLVEPCILAGCPIGGTVLDPFLGSGTTLAVAEELGRNGIGIELNPNYAALAEERMGRGRLKQHA